MIANKHALVYLNGVILFFSLFLSLCVIVVVIIILGVDHAHAKKLRQHKLKQTKQTNKKMPHVQGSRPLLSLRKNNRENKPEYRQRLKHRDYTCTTTIL
ncbi:MAG: hypothetical protein JOS17DRAFT_751073 [Linnemannia elongata]|nr:MAG: hypothetical protein JOS17DRAFT_751073 [Linnemannia elongata]